MTRINKHVGLLVFAAIIFSVFFLALLWTPGAAYAQCAKQEGGFIPLECFEQSRKLQGLYTTSELGPFIQRLFVGAIALGAMLAVLRLAWAGFIYMGSDMWSRKDHAKEIMRDTMLGLFLLLAVWVILNQINPEILKLNIVTPPATGSISNPSGYQGP